MLESMQTRWTTFQPAGFRGTAKKIKIKPNQKEPRFNGSPLEVCDRVRDQRVPSLCRVQLLNSGSDVYPQVLDSKLQEPGSSRLWAWTEAWSAGREKNGGKIERSQRLV